MSNAAIQKMERSLDKFNKEIKEFVQKKMPAEVSQFQRMLVLEALRRIVERTPVDTGRAKGNWQVTIAAPAAAAIEAFDKDGAETIQKGLAAIAGLKPYQVVWISNNVDYIEFLEDGSSKQAPRGMCRLTIDELRMMIRSGLKSG
jgi:hypothetical protein